MAKQQHRPGVKTVNKKEPKLRGADVAAALLARLGEKHKDEVFICADEATFWAEYLPSITVDGVEIELGPDALPLPAVIARKLADLPGSKLRRYEEMEAWLEGASDQEVLMLAQTIG